MKHHMMLPTAFYVDVVNYWNKRQVPRDDPEWNSQVANVKVGARLFFLLQSGILLKKFLLNLFSAAFLLSCPHRPCWKSVRMW